MKKLSIISNHLSCTPLFASFMLAFIILSTLVLSPPLSNSEAEEKVIDTTVGEANQLLAEVNATKITKKDLDEELSMALPPNRTSMNEKQTHDLKKYLLNKLIERELLTQAAKKAVVVPTEKEIKKILDQMIHHFGSPEAFDKMLTTKGMNRKKFTEGLKRDLLLKTYLKDNVLANVEITDAVARAIFDKDPKKFASPEEVRARHILFKLDDKTTAEEEAKIKAKAEKVLEEARKEGVDFAALAKQHSEGPSRQKGGELSYFTKNQMVKPFAEAAFSLKPGEISDLVKTRFGYHIIKLEDHRGGEKVSFKEVKDRVKAQLSGKKQQEVLTKKIKALRKNAKVIVYFD